MSINDISVPFNLRLVLILAACNIPLYLIIGRFLFFQGWEDFFDSMFALLRAGSRHHHYYRMLSDDDDETVGGGGSAFNFLLFLIVCVGIVVGEWKLIEYYGLSTMAPLQFLPWINRIN